MLRNAISWIGCAAAITACDAGESGADPVAERPGSLDATKDEAPGEARPTDVTEAAPDDADPPDPDATERCDVRFTSTQNVVVINGRVVSDVRSSTCEGREVRGSGALRAERRTLAPFTALRVGDELAVELVRGAPALDLLFDDNLLAQVVSEVRDGALTLRVRDEGVTLAPSKGARLVVSAPDLTLVEAQDTASLRGTLSGSALTVRALGASAQELSVQSAKTLRVEASGASQVSLSGSSVDLDVTASGAARVVAGTGTKATVSASGAAQVTLRATEALRATASGVAQITVLGSPSGRDVRTEGVARVGFAE